MKRVHANDAKNLMVARPRPVHAGGMLLESLVRDVMLSLRVLRRQPAYSLTALLTLALGLATTTAMFAVIDATLLRPLPDRKSVV